MSFFSTLQALKGVLKLISYIKSLYGIESGSYNALFGSIELPAVTGTPRVFVIGGGGSGVPVYRRLWRLGVPFAAGVLQENDLDYPAARALAAAVVSERPFEPVGAERLSEAMALLQTCRAVLCPLESYGSMNDRNRQLRDEAEARKLLLPTDVPDAELRRLALDNPRSDAS